MTDKFTKSQLADMLYKTQVKPSVQRIAILGHIANDRKHPTADEIYGDMLSEFPTMSRTTVYNTLHTLVGAGLLRQLDIDAGNVRYDLAPQPQHSHFVCRRCGRIFDMAIPSGLEDSVTGGFTIDSVDVYYKGLCPDCK